jgi:hypothetical protein
MIEFRGVRTHLKLQKIEPALVEVLSLLCAVSARSGKNIRINSLNDHVHGKNSLHKSSLAVDCAIHHRNGRPDHGAMRTLATVLRRELGYGYDLVFDAPGHRTHIHIEFDMNERPRTNA